MSHAVIRELDDTRRYQCAVMFTDIAGFTKLMRKEEQRTIQKLESHQQRLEMLHQQFDGQVIQYYGDGSLSTFKDAADAVACAVAIQQHVAQLDLPLRIGIHYGDVVRKGKAVYGHGVNVASRIESVGIPNSVLFSQDIWEQVRHKGFEARSLGGLYFKHINKPIKVYGLLAEGLDVPDKKHLEGKLADRRGIKHRTTVIGIIAIALVALGILLQRNLTLSSLLDDQITTLGVMPLEIQQVDALGETFGSGLMENMVTSLSSFYGMQVLSSRATAAYHDSDKRPSEIGQELGASHLLFGTCRPGNEDSIRINLELVDVRDEKNVWAQSISASAKDFNARPDEIIAGLTDFLQARENPFMQTEDEDIAMGGTMSLTELELVAEARDATSEGTRNGYAEAIHLLEKALDKDSSLALDHALLSQNYTLQYATGYGSFDEASNKAIHHAGQAFLYDRMLPEAFAALALNNYYYFEGEPVEILELLQQAIQLRPSYGFGHYLMGKAYYDFKDLEQAQDHFEVAYKLNPDQYAFGKMMGLTAYAAGEQRKATRLLKSQIRKFPAHEDALSTWIIYLAENEDFDKAKEKINDLPNGLMKWKTKLHVSALEGSDSDFETLYSSATEQFPNEDFSENLLIYYTLQGEQAKTWDLLRQSFAERKPWLRRIRHLPLPTAITENPEFDNLLSELGMVELGELDI